MPSELSTGPAPLGTQAECWCSRSATSMVPTRAFARNPCHRKGAVMSHGLVSARKSDSSAPQKQASALEPAAVVSGQAGPGLHSLTALQAMVGNRAVLGLLAAGQAKLDVGASDDRSEREADQVARQVVEMIRRAGPHVPAVGDVGVRRRPVEVERRSTPAAQAEVGPAGGSLAEETERAIGAARSGGAALDGSTRAVMEGAFGADFSGVRVHTGPAATDLNARVEAQAFTVGRDIFFRGAAPDVATSDGQELLAHELTHTIQQGVAGIRRSTPPSSTLQPATARTAIDPVRTWHDQRPQVGESADKDPVSAGDRHGSPASQKPTSTGSKGARTASPTRTSSTQAGVAHADVARGARGSDPAPDSAADRPDPTLASQILRLQRSAGNRATQSGLAWMDAPSGSGDRPALGEGGSGTRSTRVQRLVTIQSDKKPKPYGLSEIGAVIGGMRKESKQKTFTLTKEQREHLEELLRAEANHPYQTYTELYQALPAAGTTATIVESPKAAASILQGVQVTFAGGAKVPTLLGELESKPGLYLCCGSAASAVRFAIDRGEFSKFFNRVVLVKNGTEGAVVAEMLAASHGVPCLATPEDVEKWLGERKLTEFLGQTPQMRGDMHDVVPALTIRGDLGVVVCMQDDAGGRKDAQEILSYYSGVRERVSVFHGSIGNLTGPVKDKLRKITYATGLLFDAAIRDPSGTRVTVMDATTGGAPDEALSSAYEHDLTERGFNRSAKYVIINYRDSGHKPGEGREPSHPEFDTGETGFWQLFKMVSDLGFTPVPMGMPPLGEGMTAWPLPNLVEYWKLPSCTKLLGGRNKRQMEYGLLRYLAQTRWVRSLSMRSGSTDAMVFAGIESISLDLASEGLAEEKAQAANLHRGTGSARSWRRAAMRELIIRGGFHQGFFDDPRPEAERGPSWLGAFSGQALSAIRETILQFFGSADDPKEKVLGPAKNSPLADPEGFAKQIPDVNSEGESGQQKKFVEFANELRKLHDQR